MSEAAGESKLGAQAAGIEEGGRARPLGVVLSGELSGSGSAQLSGADLIAASASMTLRGRDVKAVLANGLPPLELGVIRGKVVLEQGVATLQDVRAYGLDGDLAANGEVQVAREIGQSMVQLTLSLRPSVEGRASFGLLLNMLPHAPNEGPYHVQGVLNSPSLS
jgi:hypothetical protein